MDGNCVRRLMWAFVAPTASFEIGKAVLTVFSSVADRYSICLLHSFGCAASILRAYIFQLSLFPRPSLVTMPGFFHVLRDGLYLCAMITVFFCVFGAYDKAKDPKYAVQRSL